jgi:tRNA threonylcarbamoyladenosine biosynthesis protein TsaB
MLVLAFDTTSEAGGAALYRDGECLARIASQGPTNRYSVALFQMVEQLVRDVSARHAAALKSQADIELYAVANGPGSFTGIRVGLAAAQAWARAFGRPARGVSVLEALVETTQPENRYAVPILNAYRGEFYLSGFRRAGGSAFVSAGEGLVLNPEALKDFLAQRLDDEGDVTCIVRAHDQAAQSLRASLPERLRWQTVPGTVLDAIARLGLRAASEGNLPSPAELDAYYIRRLDAELNWKP